MLATRGLELGVTLPRVDELPAPAARFACNPQLSGHGGGHSVNVRTLAATGVRPLGRFEGADGSVARFATDLNEKLRFADRFFDERLRGRFDAYAERSGEALPPAETSDVEPAPADLPETSTLDLRAEGVSTVVWTSGYRPTLEWIDLLVLDEFGLPRQVAGRTMVPGLWCIGLPWLVDMGSANLVSLVRDAEALISAM
jgi:putative flavoprotein involved in K+ transport